MGFSGEKIATETKREESPADLRGVRVPGFLPLLLSGAINGHKEDKSRKEY